MPPETYKEQIARELLRLGVTDRLKNAPRFHFWEIGKGKREAFKGIDAALVAFQRREMDGEKLTKKEKAAYQQLTDMFSDPGVNPYTQRFFNADTQTSSKRLLYVDYGYEEGIFKLTDPAETTKRISDHFYPIRWKDFEEYSDWELMREVIPAMQVARAEFKVYEERRWLYDERSQRIAETLAYRIEHIYKNKLLPQRMKIDEEQQEIFEGYADRLERGVDARRWFQDIVARVTGKKRTRKRKNAE